MSPDEVKVLSKKIDKLADGMARMETTIKMLVPPGSAPMCAVHERRMDVMEKEVAGIQASQGKQNLISITLASVTTGIILAIKAWAGSGK